MAAAQGDDMNANVRGEPVILLLSKTTARGCATGIEGRSLASCASASMTSAARLVSSLAARGGDFDIRRFRPNIVIDTQLAGLAEQQWIGGTLHAGEISANVEIPTIRCTVPLREQAGLPANPEVMRTVSRHGERCFGVYADIAATGTLRVGDVVGLDPPRTHGAAVASLGRLAGRVKRNAVKTGNRMLPR